MRLKHDLLEMPSSQKVNGCERPEAFSLRGCKRSWLPTAEDLFAAEREEFLALRQAWKESGCRGELSVAQLEVIDRLYIGNPGRREIEETRQKEATQRTTREAVDGDRRAA